MDARGPIVAKNMKLLSEGVCWACEIPLVRADRGICSQCGRDYILRDGQVFERAPVFEQAIGKDVRLLLDQGCVIVHDDACVTDGPIPVGAMVEFGPYPLYVEAP